MFPTGKIIRLHVTVTVWNKEAFGLFNLHAPITDVYTFNYLLTKSKYFYGCEARSQLFFVNEPTEDPSAKGLRKLAINFASALPINEESNYIKSIPNSQAAVENQWLLMEDKLHSLRMSVEENDIIRFGRQKVRFVKIHHYTPNAKKPSSIKPIYQSKTMTSTTSLQPVPIHGSMKEFSNSKINIVQKNDSRAFGSNSLFCRICLESPTEDNPFENDLCLCSAKMPAHITCVITWMSKKCEKQNKNGVVYFDFTQLTCDICKSQYPATVNLFGKAQPIVDIKYSKFTSHIAMEVLENETNKVKGIFVIDLATAKEKAISVGRNDKNDIHFKDISVSRHHANIFWNNGRVYILDQDSKFGSLKLIEKRISFKESNRKKIVIDKFMFEIHALRKKDCDCMKRTKDIWHDPDDRSALKAYCNFLEVQAKKHEMLKVKINTRKNMQVTNNLENAEVSVIEEEEMVYHEFEREVEPENSPNEMVPIEIPEQNGIANEGRSSPRQQSLQQEEGLPVVDHFSDERNIINISENPLAETHLHVAENPAIDFSTQFSQVMLENNRAPNTLINSHLHSIDPTHSVGMITIKQNNSVVSQSHDIHNQMEQLLHNNELMEVKENINFAKKGNQTPRNVFSLPNPNHKTDAEGGTNKKTYPGGEHFNLDEIKEMSKRPTKKSLIISEREPLMNSMSGEDGA